MFQPYMELSYHLVTISQTILVQNSSMTPNPLVMLCHQLDVTFFPHPQVLPTSEYFTSAGLALGGVCSES